jgi:hypothetical protein
MPETMHELELESRAAETGEQWADICAREADIIAKREPRTITARIRFPVEFLVVVDEYAATHGLPRSVAVRMLIMRGMAWEDAKQQPQQLAA